ncbi:hypothetical protein KC19_2G281800 [Ceratodon purpureus]|uniref:Nucleolar protein 9 n=1 Tax=Ceratodon purpureus TaxID=3225 RepID=A0A8T0J1G8_CERPU|nr:hypothetical protein KC19_2G281800 [Ceratodon purpureus]
MAEERRPERGRGRGRGRGGGRGRGEGRGRHGRDAGEEGLGYGYEHGRDGGRGQVDAETQQYYAEINEMVGEGGGTVVDEEERAMVIANALDESRGKELQLACNPACGRVLEVLLSGCDTLNAALFLERCTEVFGSMSLDPGGSHVAEAALKALAYALQGSNVRSQEWYPAVERTLSRICEALGEGFTGSDLINSRYGSHVLRQLISLCSGIPIETLSKSGAGGKGNNSLAERLGTKGSKFKGGGAARLRGHRFGDQLHVLVGNLLKSCEGKMEELRSSSAGGPALQFMLRALEGDEEAVTHSIQLMLECAGEEEPKEGLVLETASVDKIVDMIQDSSSSHLMEVMLQVASDTLYLEMFQRFFRHRLLQLSVHPSANFVVQALIASARHPGQVTMMLEELENSFSEIFGERRGTVVGALLAACLRFRIKQREICRALTRAINPDTPSPNRIVPRMLFLEGLSGTGRFPPEWKAPFGSRMSVLGCAMLQTAFSYPEDCCQQFCASMAAQEPNDVLEAVRDPGGSRVIEAFLSSVAAPMKHKHRLIAKLKGHFAELALSPICSYTVEKCFQIGDIKLKEMIAAELALSQSELSKTRHGPYLLKRCDIASYAKGPEQWRMRESSKQGTREAYANIFQADAEEDIPNPEHGFEAVAPPSEGKKKRTSVDETTHNNQELVVMSEPPSISALELDGTMAQLGFNLSKFPHSKKKKKDSAQQPELSFFEPEDGAVVKKDEIDALFKKEKKGDKTKKEKKGDKSVEKKEKKGKKRDRQEEGGIQNAVEPEAVQIETAAVADSLKAVMGALEGGTRKSKKKKGDGSAKQRTQNVMI